ncbi:gamma-butyrolactone biosynthesis protein [Nocardia yamanashiensis]|uniref:ScbA/BarX family gamma-butyrolactone biosynthesis protein n=1 Tax=Nocardia yamanashiensis TaxID=209247 RepID=UPI001E52870C|nr:ScbA/BarX family gamma-butyrolactone biosynthesis protein [Nocardia yamanashiensis]UGT45239.1 gamma-butyrolactone biosynthesis protein [Nocardia yamanashiensis]
MTQTGIVTATHVRTVPRMLTHRCAVAEVFVTSLDVIEPDTFLVGAQLPRMHGHYGDHTGPAAQRHDLVAVMEAVRQACIAIAHEFYAVPGDQQFLVRNFNGTVADSPLWSIGSAPADLVMRARALRKFQRDDQLSGLHLMFDISCDGIPMGTVDLNYSWVPPWKWDAARNGQRNRMGLGAFQGAGPVGERAAAALVSREIARNVVIGPPRTEDGRTHAILVADTSHPILFDHELDHAPGNLLIEAGRQVALAALQPYSRRLIGVTSTFEQFVELDRPTECLAELSDSGVDATVVRCEIRQDGVVAARIDLEFSDEATPSGAAGATA